MSEADGIDPSDGEAPVIVVGGGIAGLVAARDLALGGRRVTLLEASDRLGGQVDRHTVGGLDLDAGAESFATRRGTVADFLRTVHLDDDIVTPVDTPAWIFRGDGSALPLPATSVLGIPAVPLANDVVAAIGSRAAWRAQLDTLLPGTVGAKARTLGELVRRRMGAGLLDALVRPVVRGVHSVDPDDLELDRAVPGLRAALLWEGSLGRAVQSLRMTAPAGSQVAGIRGGMFRLVEVLTADLQRFGVEVRLGARATEIEPGLVRIGREELLGDVVMAAPDPDAAPGRRITLVTLVIDAPELRSAPRGTGVLVAPDATAVAARALTHVTAKWPWLAERAGGLEVLRLSYDARPDDAVARATRDASALLGAALPTPLDAAVVDWERAASRLHAVDGMSYVGEAGAGTGLTAVIGQARAQAGSLLGGGSEQPG